MSESRKRKSEALEEAAAPDLRDLLQEKRARLQEQEQEQQPNPDENIEEFDSSQETTMNLEPEKQKLPDDNFSHDSEEITETESQIQQVSYFSSRVFRWKVPEAVGKSTNSMKYLFLVDVAPSCRVGLVELGRSGQASKKTNVVAEFNNYFIGFLSKNCVSSSQ